MRLSQKYLLEYLDFGFGSGTDMGSAVGSMNKKYWRVLRKQAKGKRHSQALKEVEGILKRLKNYKI